MECYDEWLNEEEFNDMVYTKRVMLVISMTELDIKRQVKYPDTRIASYGQEQIYPDPNSGTTSLFSPKQQRIGAETKAAAVYIDAKTGRSVDIRTLGGGWPKVYEAFTTKSEVANKLKEQSESEIS